MTFTVMPMPVIMARLALAWMLMSRVLHRKPLPKRTGAAPVNSHDKYTLSGYCASTYTGYIFGSMNTATKKSVSQRLNRVEGQVRGVNRMIEEDRYCIDVLTQLKAIRAALNKIEEEVLRDHVHHCVAGAFRSDDEADQHRKIDELVGVVSQLTR